MYVFNNLYYGYVCVCVYMCIFYASLVCRLMCTRRKFDEMHNNKFCAQIKIKDLGTPIRLCV